MLRALMIGLMMIVPSMGFSMSQLPSKEIKSDGQGKQAFDFTLATTSGIPQSLTQARAGKKTVMFFWATWCPHCHDALLSMNEQIDSIHQKGINIVLVDVGESKEEAKEYLLRNKITLESFLDENNTLQEPYQLYGVPTLYFIDEQGAVKNVTHEFPSNYEELFTK